MKATIMQESVGYWHNPKGYIMAQASFVRANSCACPCIRQCYISYSYNQQLHFPSHTSYTRINHLSYVMRNIFKGKSWGSSYIDGRKRIFFNHKQVWSKGFCLHAALDVASAIDVINDLGLDTLTFLAVTVLVVPGFRIIKASPILGFFFAGVVLNQFGLIRNLTDVKVLSEWGILFLLFEMGLELSLARLKALAKFAFGMGLTQVVLSTLAFTAFELPPNAAVGTRILEFLFHSRPDLVNIRSIDEAVVIGAALSLSSSAFVLQKRVSFQLDLAQQLWEYFYYRILRLSPS